MAKKTKKKLKAIDLFAGIGGIRKGFEDLCETVYANDFDALACKTYEANFGKIDCSDLREVVKGMDKKIKKFDILLGGFPCQAFSIAGKRQGFADTRGTMFFEVEKILNKYRPKAFLLENVRNLENHDNGNTFKVILKVLTEKLGYDVHYKVLNAKDYGVPQNRPRIYIVGFKKKTNFSFPEPTRRVKLKSILQKNVDPKHYISQLYYEGMERHKNRHAQKGNGFGYMVLDPEGVSNALVVGGMGRERNLIKDKPVNIYKEGLDKKTTKNALGLRKLTVRECARLQGFPDDFIFPVKDSPAYKQLGNSVAVPVIKAIADQMAKYL
ncbi:MAG: DNA cytosine methyltransferase [Chloroherpetonaceae bacterium]